MSDSNSDNVFREMLSTSIVFIASAIGIGLVTGVLTQFVIFYFSPAFSPTIQDNWYFDWELLLIFVAVSGGAGLLLALSLTLLPLLLTGLGIGAVLSFYVLIVGPLDYLRDLVRSTSRKKALDQTLPLEVRASHARSYAKKVAKKLELDPEDVIQLVNRQSGFSLQNPKNESDLLKAIQALEDLKKLGNLPDS